MDFIAKTAIKGPPWLIYLALMVAATLFTDIFQGQARACSGGFRLDGFDSRAIDGLNQNKCGHISTVPYQWMLTNQSFQCLNETSGENHNPSIGEKEDDDYDDDDDEDNYDMYYRRHEARNGGRRARLVRGLPSSRRVGGGFTTRTGQYPSHVQIFLTNSRGEWSCGGILIHNDLVMTAAHCVERSARFSVTVVAGTTLRASSNNPRGGEVSSVTKVCVPADFDMDQLEEDWALVRLDQPVKYSNNIQPACLELNAPPLNEAVCVGVGVGKSEPASQQQKALLMKKCRREDNQRTGTCYRAVDNRGMLCDGDDGGALYCYDNCDRKGGTKMFAVGITSRLSRRCSAKVAENVIFSDMFKNRDSIVSLMISCMNKTVESFERRYRWKTISDW